MTLSKEALIFTRFRKPVLTPGDEGFDGAAAYNPAAVVKNGRVYLFYRGQRVWHGLSSIGLAISDDGANFEKLEEPVLKPEYDYERMGGCEDPRIVEVNGTYYMTYTAYDGKVARLAMASSKNLIDWKREGILFPGWGWSKSGAILPTKINGYYWMYFGDSNIWIAKSKDMLHWRTSKEWIVVRPRRGYFDSMLVEPGPPPILSKEGILLIYNGADRDGCYYVGWALFSKKDPGRMIARAEKPILKPETRWERFGQVPNVVFSEALIKFQGRWHLYYGASDTFVCLAYTENKEI